MVKKQLIYLCEGIGSVFESQVIELLNGICERNLFQKSYLFIGIKEKSDKSRLKREKIHPKLEVVFFKTFPNYPFYNFLSRYSLKKALKPIDIKKSETIFHIREEILTWHLLNILDGSDFDKILPDIRGANMEEVKQYFGFNSLREKLKVRNYKKAINSLKKVGRISVVSESLKDYLSKNFGLKQDNIFVTSCLAGNHFKFDLSKREKIRRELNLEEKDILLVFSSGGLAKWQNAEVLKYFAEKGIKILNLSKNELRYNNIINKFVDYYEIPDYLNAADAALLWRDKSIVNKVASPVKFSEYLCCGLPVITNDSVDLVKDLIVEKNTGVILNDIEEFNEDTICKAVKTDRKFISQTGQNKFGIETILNKYQLLYNKF